MTPPIERQGSTEELTPKHSLIHQLRKNFQLAIFNLLCEKGSLFGNTGDYQEMARHLDKNITNESLGILQHIIRLNILLKKGTKFYQKIRKEHGLCQTIFSQFRTSADASLRISVWQSGTEFYGSGSVSNISLANHPTWTPKELLYVYLFFMNMSDKEVDTWIDTESLVKKYSKYFKGCTREDFIALYMYFVTNGSMGYNAGEVETILRGTMLRSFYRAFMDTKDANYMLGPWENRITAKQNNISEKELGELMSRVVREVLFAILREVPHNLSVNWVKDIGLCLLRQFPGASKFLLR